MKTEDKLGRYYKFSTKINSGSFGDIYIGNVGSEWDSM
jgi:hypothetical protein